MLTDISKDFNSAISVVDSVVVDFYYRRFLLAQKEKDGNKYRFIGGFTDISDESYERAAHRELWEEVGMIEVENPPIYLGSARIDDERYKNDRCKLFSSFFVFRYVFGAPMAQDDIIKVKWFDFSDIKKDIIVDTHKPLQELLKRFMTINLLF